MFSKGNRKTKDAALSVLAAGTKVVGDLSSAGQIQIDGLVEGDIDCAELTVGESGVVKGNVRSDVVLIRGQVMGHVQARHVTLTRSARLTGDVLQEEITIEPGAIFQGHSRRLEKQVQPQLNLVIGEVAAKA